MMAFHDELKALQQFLVSLAKQAVGRGTQKFKYTRECLLAVGMGMLCMLAYMGYRWFVISRNQTAQKAFSEYVQDYQMALKQNSPQEWERVAALFAYGRHSYKSTALSPYFLMMESDIQLRQGKRAESIATLEKAIAETTNTTMQSMLRTKRALMLMDADEQDMREKGVQSLVGLARDEANAYRDMALFYLGRYYWAHGNYDEAQKNWQELVDAQWFDKSAPSAWLQEAKAALAQIK